MTPDELAAAVRTAVQAILDADADGWHCAQFVIAMGLERVNSDGHMESTPWLWAPPSQPEWMTDGLIDSAYSLRATSDMEDD